MTAEKGQGKLNRRLIRVFLSFGVMLLLLLLIGAYLYFRVDGLLNVYLEEQGKKQAEALSEVVSRQFEGELNSLATVASEFTTIEEVSVDALNAMQASDRMSRIGVQKVDGTPFFGITYKVHDFPCIKRAIHGEEAISYSQGKGLLFCVPAFRDRNVAYVIYRFYPENVLYDYFGVSSFGGAGRVCVSDRNNRIVIPAIRNGKAEKTLFTERVVVDGFSELTRELYLTGSAATFRLLEQDDVMLYAAEIAGSDFYLTGYVPKSVVQEGVQYIKMVVALVFAILVALVFLGGFLMARLEARSHESEQLRALSLIERRSNAAKSDFLANMSHEIRTPINAILGMNEMILNESGDEQIKVYAENIENAGNNLLSIINDILDFSKIEAGRMEILDAPYRLSAILNDVCSMIELRVRSKNIAFVTDVDPTIPDGLYGDGQRIRQCMLNLLTNAVKYTNEGSITLHLSGEPTDLESGEPAYELIVSVKDTGIGIRKEDIGKLFDKFERVDLKQNNTIEGTGLGLAITQNVLHLMGGSIQVESEYGIGSVFTMRLMQRISENHPIGDFRKKKVQVKTAPAPKRIAYRAPSARILAVDDTIVNLTVIKGLLKHTGIQVDSATCGEDAINMADEVVYDLILMDQRMPNMDGTETLMHIRNSENGKNRTTPAIALTADVFQDAKERYLEAGFTDYLSKPVAGAALEEMMLRYLPADKILPEGSEKTDPQTHTAGREGSREADFLKKVYDRIGALSYEEAIRYMNDDDILRVTLTQFYEDILPNADAIEGLLLTDDLENYTIKVHGLKSSARLVGASALSGKAEKLEHQGNLLQESGQEDTDLKNSVVEETKELLADYRDLHEKLAAVFQTTDETDENAEEISADELHQIYDAILEFASVYDLDSIDLLMKKVKACRIPGSEKEKCQELEKHVRNVDWAEIERTLRC